MLTDALGGDIVGWGVAGGGLIAWLAQTVWSKFFGADRSNQILLTQLTERIASQEERIKSLEDAHAQERGMRLDAEMRVRWLELQVQMLKAELSRHGIAIPPHIEANGLPPDIEPHA